MAFMGELEGAEHLVELINHKIWAWRVNDRALTDPYVHRYNRCLEDIKRARATYDAGATTFSEAQTRIYASISTLAAMSDELNSILDEVLVIPPPEPEPLPEPVSAFSDSEDEAPAGGQSLRATIRKAISGAAGGRRRAYAALKKWINPAKECSGKHSNGGEEGAVRHRKKLSRQFCDPYRVTETAQPGTRGCPAGGERVPNLTAPQDPHERAQNSQSGATREPRGRCVHRRRAVQDGGYQAHRRHHMVGERNGARDPQMAESFYGNPGGGFQRPQSVDTTYDGPKGTLSYYQDKEILAGPFARESCAPSAHPSAPNVAKPERSQRGGKKEAPGPENMPCRRVSGGRERPPSSAHAHPRPRRHGEDSSRKAKQGAHTHSHDSPQQPKIEQPYSRPARPPVPGPSRATYRRLSDPLVMVGDPRVRRLSRQHRSSHKKVGEARTHREPMPDPRDVVECSRGRQELPADSHARHPPRRHKSPRPGRMINGVPKSSHGSEREGNHLEGCYPHYLPGQSSDSASRQWARSLRGKMGETPYNATGKYGDRRAQVF